MQRRKFSREFKVEAVKLVRDRGVSVAQAARDLDVHENVLRKWVRDHEADPGAVDRRPKRDPVSFKQVTDPTRFSSASSGDGRRILGQIAPLGTGETWDFVSE
jgi:transposase